MQSSHAQRPLIVIVIVIAAACAGAPTEPGGPAMRVAGPMAEPPASPALSALLSRPDLDGAALPAMGRRTAVVFFASWCGACRAHLGELQPLAAQLPELRVILVNAYEDYADRGDEAAMRELLADRAVRWPVVRGDESLRRAFGGVPKIPAMFVFDDRGHELERFAPPARRIPAAATLRRVLSSEPAAAAR